MEKLHLKLQGNVVSKASSIDRTRAYYAFVTGSSYLQQLHQSKMVTIKCNLKTLSKCKFLNVA